MKQLILIIALVAGSVALASYLIKTKPEPRKRVRSPTIPVVEIMTPQAQSFTQKINSSGSVEANRSTNIIAEVSGKVTQENKAFQEGNYFRKGQHLLSIDNTNYKNAIIIASAEVSQRELELKTEQNLANLAVRDFQLLGNNRRPNEIASRKPHIAATLANLQASKIRLQQARDDLNKTRVLAPYEGRLLTRSVDIGQFVTPGTLLGQVYSTDYVEVRLPLSLADYEQLKLPENFRNQQSKTNTDKPEVKFAARYGNKSYEWTGRVVRASPAMDARTRQISVIAQIEDPFTKKSGSDAPPIKIGQFLQAEIIGTTLRNVFVIPTAATRQNREVMIYDEGKVRILPIEVLASDKDKLVIAEDSLPALAKLIVTPMPSAKDGMTVRLPGEGKKGGEGKRREGGKGRPEAGAPQKINTSEASTGKASTGKAASGNNGERRQRPNADQKGQGSEQAKGNRGNLTAEQRAERRKSNTEGTN
jgi:RND family efflux transporter MFP subunit